MNGDSLVPNSYVSGSGYNLGKVLSGVRSSGYFWKGHPLEGERVKWFESLPKWTWSCHDSAWETFKEEMQAYVDENGTSLVPRDYVSPSAYNLGKILSAVRSNGHFWKGKDDEEERKAWLQNLPGWTWNRHDSAWETFKKEIQAYVDENGTSLVPFRYVSPSTYKLGMNLSAVRSNGMFWKGNHDEEERKAWLQNLKGWTWNCLDSAWETFKEEMEDYVDENGTSLVPQSYVSPSTYNLGKNLAAVRSNGMLWKGKHDEEERKTWLQNLKGWTWNCLDSA